MRADPADQRRLLDLQATDTALAQLAHRQQHLPERAELERLDGALRQATDQQVRAQTAVDDLDRDIARQERDVEQVRQRSERDRKRLESGQGQARELEGLQHELTSLARRCEGCRLELSGSELATVRAAAPDDVVRHDECGRILVRTEESGV